MHPFEIFTKLYQGYRWAGEYNGHLDHRLGDIIKVMLRDQGAKMKGPVRKALRRPKLHDAVLPDLRKQLRDTAKDHVTIRQMMALKLEKADEYRLSRGPRAVPLPCPWCVDSGEGPPIDDYSKDSRRVFRRGDEDRLRLLEFIGLRKNLARTTVRRFLWARGLIDNLDEDAIKCM